MKRERTLLQRSLRVLARLGWSLLGALALFHGALLLRRFADDSITQPAVLVRWLVAFLILGLGAELHRRGYSLVRGRTACVLWLLVLVLHVGPAIADVDRELLVTLPAAALWVFAASRAARSLGRVAAPNGGTILRRALFDLPIPEPPLSGPDRFSPRPPPAVLPRPAFA